MKTTLISFLLITFVSTTLHSQTFKIDHYEPEGNGFVFDNIIIEVYNKPAGNGDTRVYTHSNVWDVSYKYNGKIYKANDAPINGKIDNLFAIRITHFDILFTNGLNGDFSIYPPSEDGFNIYCCEEKYTPQSIQISNAHGSGIDDRIESMIKNSSNSSNNTSSSSNKKHTPDSENVSKESNNNISNSNLYSEPIYQKETDRTIESLNKFERDFKSQINKQIESSRQFNNYSNQVRSATSLTKSSDPDQLIREFEQKKHELKGIFDKRLINKTKEIEKGVQDLKNEGNQFADLAGSISKISVQKQVRDAKKKATKDLERELRGYLIEIQNNILSESKKNRLYYMKHAISAVDQKSEEYYLNMVEYYDCKINNAKNEFSIHSTSWINPNCDTPIKPYQLDPAPTSKQLHGAYKRKKRSNNKELQNEAPKMLDMAIKMNPTNIDYLYERSKSFDLGTDKNLMYLVKCKHLEPKNSIYSDEYCYSTALKQKKSNFFKYYLDNYPNGKYTTIAKEKLDYYLQREIREVSYRKHVNKLNTELNNKKFEMAQETFQKINKTEFYSDEDINEIALLKEYILYHKGKKARSSDVLLIYLKEYKHGNWKSEVLNLLNETLIEDGNSSLSKKEYKKAIYYYSKFLEYFPSSQKTSYTNKQIKKARQGINNKTSYIGLHFVADDNLTMGFGNVSLKSKGFGFYWLPIANFSKIFADDEVEINEGGQLVWTNEYFDDTPLLINRTKNVKSYMAYGCSIGATHKLLGPVWLSGGIGYGKYIQRDKITYDENRPYSNERFTEESLDRSKSGGTLYFEYGIYLRVTKKIFLKTGFLSSSKMNSVQFGLLYSIHAY